MRKIAKQLKPLDASARSRVLGWVISALEVRDLQLPDSGSTRGGKAGAAGQPDANSGGVASRLSVAVQEWLSDEQDYGDSQ